MEEKPRMGQSGVLLEFPEIRQAPHFPLVRKACKQQAAKFFHCLSTKSIMGNDYDVNAAKKGAWLCRDEKEIYDLCMITILQKEKVQIESRK